jgi:hypothetical protein
MKHSKGQSKKAIGKDTHAHIKMGVKHVHSLGKAHAKRTVNKG